MRPPPPRPRDEDQRILPLINVVFLLLIFFMLAGRLAASDPFTISPPESVSQTPPHGHEMLVLIGGDGRLAVDGVETDAAGLQAALQARMASGEAPQVHLKADGGAEAAQVIAIMERMRAAGVERLKMLTVPGSG